MADNVSQSISETGVPTRSVQRDPEQTRKALEGWFAAALPDRSQLRITEVRVPDASGVANETLMCDATWTEDGQEHSDGYVVRVNSPDFLYKDVDLEVHANMYRALRDEPGIPVPVVIGYCADTSVLGQAFFVMERLDGQVPGDTPPFHTTGWVYDLLPEQREALWRRSVEVMARLHRVDPAKLPFLERPRYGGNGLEQDLGYWLDYGQWASRGRPHPVIDTAADWIRANVPSAPVCGLAWGDSRIPNIMFRDLEVVSVFDWDMVCLAGAESDLAWWTVMDYTNTESGGVQRLPGIGSPAETVRLWQELSGRPVRDMDFHLVYAAYRLAVILVRLGDLFASAQSMPAEITDALINNNPGVQYLAQMLEIRYDGPIQMPWPGLQIS
ncbi:MAG TPA: phosphotransferase family protein [Mycobacteriales bacterium]|jgi:aminoglycoside phosphotransferase (APT) family kinase protein|nr:phosphotransferase family protein [Mycobacteriales bacterium]